MSAGMDQCNNNCNSCQKLTLLVQRLHARFTIYKKKNIHNDEFLSTFKKQNMLLAALKDELKDKNVSLLDSLNKLKCSQVECTALRQTLEKEKEDSEKSFMSRFKASEQELHTLRKELETSKTQLQAQYVNIAQLAAKLEERETSTTGLEKSFGEEKKQLLEKLACTENIVAKYNRRMALWSSLKDDHGKLTRSVMKYIRKWEKGNEAATLEANLLNFSESDELGLEDGHTSPTSSPKKNQTEGIYNASDTSDDDFEDVVEDKSPVQLVPENSLTDNSSYLSEADSVFEDPGTATISNTALSPSEASSKKDSPRNVSPRDASPRLASPGNASPRKIFETTRELKSAYVQTAPNVRHIGCDPIESEEKREVQITDLWLASVREDFLAPLSPPLDTSLPGAESTFNPVGLVTSHSALCNVCDSLLAKCPTCQSVYEELSEFKRNEEVLKNDCLSPVREASTGHENGGSLFSPPKLRRRVSSSVPDFELPGVGKDSCSDFGDTNSQLVKVNVQTMPTSPQRKHARTQTERGSSRTIGCQSDIRRSEEVSMKASRHIARTESVATQTERLTSEESFKCSLCDNKAGSAVCPMKEFYKTSLTSVIQQSKFVSNLAMMGFLETSLFGLIKQSEFISNCSGVYSGYSSMGSVNLPSFYVQSPGIFATNPAVPLFAAFNPNWCFTPDEPARSFRQWYMPKFKTEERSQSTYDVSDEEGSGGRRRRSRSRSNVRKSEEGPNLQPDSRRALTELQSESKQTDSSDSSVEEIEVREGGTKRRWKKCKCSSKDVANSRKKAKDLNHDALRSSNRLSSESSCEDFESRVDNSGIIQLSCSTTEENREKPKMKRSPPSVQLRVQQNDEISNGDVFLEETVSREESRVLEELSLVEGRSVPTVKHPSKTEPTAFSAFGDRPLLVRAISGKSSDSSQRTQSREEPLPVFSANDSSLLLPAVIEKSVDSLFLLQRPQHYEEPLPASYDNDPPLTLADGTEKSSLLQQIHNREDYETPPSVSANLPPFILPAVTLEIKNPTILRTRNRDESQRAVVAKDPRLLLPAVTEKTNNSSSPKQDEPHFAVPTHRPPRANPNKKNKNLVKNLRAVKSVVSFVSGGVWKPSNGTENSSKHGRIACNPGTEASSMDVKVDKNISAPCVPPALELKRSKTRSVVTSVPEDGVVVSKSTSNSQTISRDLISQSSVQKETSPGTVQSKGKVVGGPRKDFAQLDTSENSLVFQDSRVVQSDRKISSPLKSAKSFSILEDDLCLSEDSDGDVELSRDNVKEVEIMCPGTVKAVSFDNVKEVSPDDGKEVSPDDANGVSPDDANGVSRDDLNGVTPDDGKEVSPDDANGVTPVDVNGVSPDDVNGVTPDDVNGVTPDDVNGVTPDDVNGVTPDDVNDVTPVDVNDVTPVDVNGVSPDDVNGVSPDDVSGVIPDNVIEVIRARARDNVIEVSRDNVIEISPDNVKEVSPDTVIGISPDTVIGISPDDVKERSDEEAEENSQTENWEKGVQEFEVQDCDKQKINTNMDSYESTPVTTTPPHTKEFEVGEETEIDDEASGRGEKTSAGRERSGVLGAVLLEKNEAVPFETCDKLEACLDGNAYEDVVASSIAMVHDGNFIADGVSLNDKVELPEKGEEMPVVVEEEETINVQKEREDLNEIQGVGGQSEDLNQVDAEIISVATGNSRRNSCVEDMSKVKETKGRDGSDPDVSGSVFDGLFEDLSGVGDLVTAVLPDLPDDFSDADSPKLVINAPEEPTMQLRETAVSEEVSSENEPPNLIDCPNASTTTSTKPNEEVGVPTEDLTQKDLPTFATDTRDDNENSNQAEKSVPTALKRRIPVVFVPMGPYRTRSACRDSSKRKISSTSESSSIHKPKEGAEIVSGNADTSARRLRSRTGAKSPVLSKKKKITHSSREFVPSDSSSESESEKLVISEEADDQSGVMSPKGKTTEDTSSAVENWESQVESAAVGTKTRTRTRSLEIDDWPPVKKSRYATTQSSGSGSSGSPESSFSNEEPSEKSKTEETNKLLGSNETRNSTLHNLRPRSQQGRDVTSEPQRRSLRNRSTTKQSPPNDTSSSGKESETSDAEKEVGSLMTVPSSPKRKSKLEKLRRTLSKGHPLLQAPSHRLESPPLKKVKVDSADEVKSEAAKGALGASLQMPKSGRTVCVLKQDPMNLRQKERLKPRDPAKTALHSGAPATVFTKPRMTPQERLAALQPSANMKQADKEVVSTGITPKNGSTKSTPTAPASPKQKIAVLGQTSDLEPAQNLASTSDSVLGLERNTQNSSANERQQPTEEPTIIQTSGATNAPIFKRSNTIRNLTANCHIKPSLLNSSTSLRLLTAVSPDISPNAPILNKPKPLDEVQIPPPVGDESSCVKIKLEMNEVNSKNAAMPLALSDVGSQMPPVKEEKLDNPLQKLSSSVPYRPKRSNIWMQPALEMEIETSQDSPREKRVIKGSRLLAAPPVSTDVVCGRDLVAMIDSTPCGKERSTELVSEDRHPLLVAWKRRGRKNNFFVSQGGVLASGMGESVPAIKKLLNTYWSSPYFTEELLTRTVNSLLNPKYMCVDAIVSRLMVGMVEVDYDSQPCIDTRGPCQFLTKIQQQMIALVMRLFPTYRSIVRDVLSLIEYHVYGLGRSFQTGWLTWFAVLHTSLCRIMKWRDVSLVFCYDAMYCYVSRFSTIISSVFQVWPELLPNTFDKKTMGGIFQVIAHFVMTQGEPDKQPDLKTLRAIFTMKRLYSGDTNSTQLTQKSVQDLKEDKSGPISPALILISKRQGIPWAQDKIVNQHLLQMVRDWLLKNDDPTCPPLPPAAVLTLCGIVRAFRGTESAVCTTHTLMKSLLLDTKAVAALPELEHSVCAGFIFLSRHNIEFVVDAVKRWRPTNKCPVWLIDTLLSMINSRARPPAWWAKVMSNLLESEEPFPLFTKDSSDLNGPYFVE